jgi:LysM repeat protein
MPKLGSVVLNVVYSETKDKSVDTTDRPVEDGWKVSDHVQKDPVTLKITGVCNGSTASDRLRKLESYMNAGTRLTYVGRRSFANCVITDISTPKDTDTSGKEYKFDITLKQIRVVETKVYKQKKAKKKTTAGKKQPVKKNNSKRTYTVKKGDVLSKIAQKYYGHSSYSYYMKIYNANKKTIGSDPNALKPGMKLIIP